VSRKIVLGITGGVATGKSTVTAMFVKLGGLGVSADEAAHSIILKGKPAYKKLLLAFGRGILDGKGGIDRRKLGRLAFAGEKPRKLLEKITHPSIIKELRKGIREGIKRNKFVCLEAPLLYEAHIEGLADKVITVFASEKSQVERLKEKGYSKKEALQRIKAQLPMAVKVKRADYVIMNEGRKQDTGRQVKVLAKLLVK